MKHTLDVDMLEGFEHTSILASASGDGKSKKLVIVTKLDNGEIYSMIHVIRNNEFVGSTASLEFAIDIYNDL